ncbi:MAG TPA: hypothetical protein VGP45_00815, partial [Marinobacter sp.]|nr:hypothetical protein [Marinobacter sp.]
GCKNGSEKFKKGPLQKEAALFVFARFKLPRAWECLMTKKQQFGDIPASLYSQNGISASFPPRMS